jgi:hypothetical protein
LHREHKERLAEVHAAATELTGALQIRAAAKVGKELAEPGLLIVGLVAAVVIGAGLVTVINLSHVLTIAMIRLVAVVLVVVLGVMLLPVAP